MFKSIASFVTNAVTKHKAQRVEALFKAIEDLTTNVNDH